MEEVTDEPLYRDRVCGIDIGKAGWSRAGQNKVRIYRLSTVSGNQGRAGCRNIST